MSQGELEGKLVASDFWPTCETCRFFAACKEKPKHPAYPHSWHWGKECVEFAEGLLIVRSWVGTSAIGQPHTGCKSYEVDPQHVSEPQIHHRLYLELAHERRKLEAEMEAIERRKTWSRNDEDFHASLFKRYRLLLKQQDALRSTITEALPLAIAVD
jgi:hypothetical protein